MKTPTVLRGVALLAACLFLTGCGGNFLIGEWTLDEERTIQALDQAPQPDAAKEPGKAFLKDIVGGLQKGLSRVLLAPFEGTVVEFTKTEMRRTKDGSGEVTEYEIIDRPDGDTYLVKTADGSIVTWQRVEGGVRLKLTGDTDFWVYFRPADGK